MRDKPCHHSDITDLENRAPTESTYDCPTTPTFCSRFRGLFTSTLRPNHFFVKLPQPWKFIVNMKRHSERQRLHDPLCEQISSSTKNTRKIPHHHTICSPQQTIFPCRLRKSSHRHSSRPNLKPENKEQAFGAFAFVDIEHDDVKATTQLDKITSFLPYR